MQMTALPSGPQPVHQMAADGMAEERRGDGIMGVLGSQGLMEARGVV